MHALPEVLQLSERHKPPLFVCLCVSSPKTLIVGPTRKPANVVARHQSDTELHLLQLASPRR